MSDVKTHPCGTQTWSDGPGASAQWSAVTLEGARGGGSTEDVALDRARTQQIEDDRKREKKR